MTASVLGPRPLWPAPSLDRWAWTVKGRELREEQSANQSAAFPVSSVPSQQRSSVAPASGLQLPQVHHLKQTPFFPELLLVRGSHRGHRVTLEHTSVLQTEGLLFIPACMPRDEASPPSLSPLALADPSAARSVSPAAEKPGHSLSSLKSRHPYSLGSRHVRLKPLNNPSPYVSI